MGMVGLRGATGAALVVLGLSAMVYSVVQLKAQDYLAAMLMTVIGFSLLRSGTELLRPVVGE